MGELHEQAGEGRAAVEAYETGLRRLLAGERPDLAAELAGRAIIESAIAGRPTAARLRLRAARAFLDDNPPTYRGRALDAGRLLERLEALERSAQERPRLARTIDPEPVVFPGLRIQQPVLRSGVQTPTDMVLLKRTGTDELELHALDASGDLEMRWGGLTAHDPLLLTREALYTSTLEGDVPGRRVFHRFDPVSGRELWRTQAFVDLWDPEINPRLAPRGDENATDDDLLRNSVSQEILVAYAEGVLLLIERSGRVVGINARTGAPLWMRRLPMMRVIDAHADAGVLATVGLRRRTLKELAAARNEPPPIDERLAAIDVRTGELLYDPSIDEQVSWVRVTSDGDAIVGANRVVHRFDIRAGRLAASVRVEELPEFDGIAQALGRYFVLSPFGQLIAIDTADGRVAYQRVDTGGRIVARAGHFEAHPIDGRVYLASRLGMCALDENNALVTADARRAGEATLVPFFTEDTAVTISVQGEPDSDLNFTTYRLTHRELASARLIEEPLRVPLANEPDTILAIDGHVLVTSSATTLVFRALPEAGLDRPDRPVFDLEGVYAADERAAPATQENAAP